MPSTLKNFTRVIALFSLAMMATSTVAAKSATPAKKDQARAGSPIPQDKGMYLKNGQVKRIYRSMQPHIRRARATYPAAKKRWMKGLPNGHYFFVVTRIRDQEGSEEQVFISVASIRNGSIKGYIYSKPKNVSGFQFKQPYTFPENHIIDWVITKPGGEQEGNFVGKYLSGLN